MAKSFTLKVLGGVSIEGPDGPVSGRATQRHRLALLALLAATPRGMTRDKLVALLWPERTSDKARHALSDSVYRINRALEGDPLIAAGEEIRLDDDALPSDLRAFERAVAEEDWERAAEAWTGPFLDGFHLSGSLEFERWVADRRKRLARRYADVLESLAEERAERGDRTGAAAAWQRRAVEDPYDSRVALRLMEALVAAGNPAAALRHARVHRRLLEEEFGTGPDPRVAALAERIRDIPSAGSGTDREDGEATDRTAAAFSEPGSRASAGAEPAEARTRHDPSDSAAVVPRARRWQRIALGSVGSLLLLAGGSWLLGGPAAEPDLACDPASGLPPPPAFDDASCTIAVLPLEPLGDGPRVETLADALHADLITALSKLGRFRVIQRASTLPYRPGGGRPPAGVATELDADLIVEGDVRQLGERVRVNARLSEARSGDVLWGDNMDLRFTLPDLFDVETDIVERIVGAVQRSLTAAERQRIAVPPTDEPSAWQYYHQASNALDGTRTGNVEQVRLLRRALDIDPTFAEAWAALAVTYAWRPLWTGFPTTAWDSAIVQAERALAEDPDNETAYAALSDVYGNQGRQTLAIETAREAVRLNPNDDLALHRLGRPFHERGDFVEGLRYLAEAARVSPNRSHFWAWAGHARLDLGDRARARRLYRHTLELEPGDWNGLEGMAWLHLVEDRPDSARALADRLAEAHTDDTAPLASAAMVALFTGDFVKAERRLRRVVALAPDAPVHARSTTLARTMLGFLRLRAGDTAAADTLFDRSEAFVREMMEMGAGAPRWPYEIAQIRAARGRGDDAMAWLERAYDQGFRWGWMLERNPLLDPVRDRAGFGDLLERIEIDVADMRRRADELDGLELEELGRTTVPGG